MIRLPRTRPDQRHVDAALAVVLTAGALLEIWLAGDGGGHRLGASLMALGTIAPIGIRRRWPTLVGAGVPALAAFDHSLFDPQFVGYPIATFCAMYALAAWTPRRGFLLGLALFVVANAVVDRGVSRVGVLFALVSISAMLLVRDVVVGRERRAELAERERELAAREAVVHERARLARELHDSVAHHLSILVVQAGAERRTLNDAGGSARETLAGIETLGRRSLAELRRLLGMLRSEEASGAATEEVSRR